VRQLKWYQEERLKKLGLEPIQTPEELDELKVKTGGMLQTDQNRYDF